MTTSQFHPYRAGWVVKPLRLALNTTAATTAVTAATDPSNVDRTGTECRPDPGWSAWRMPSAAGAGRPEAATFLAIRDGRPAAARRARRTERTAKSASSPSSTVASRTAPGPSTSQSAWNPRLGSRCRTGPTGASGDTATAPARASMTPPRMPIIPVRPANRGAGADDGADHRHVGRGPTQHLGQALANQYQQGQRGDQPEERQRGRIGPDGLLHLTVDEISALDWEAEVSHVLVSRPADLPLHRGGQLGESLLEPGDASRAVSQAQPAPGVREIGQHLAGGPGRQDWGLLLVGLIDQGRRDLHDGGHPVGMGELPADRHPFRVHPVVGVRDVATNSRAEHPGDERGEHDLTDRAEPGQPGQ